MSRQTNEANDTDLQLGNGRTGDGLTYIDLVNAEKGAPPPLQTVPLPQAAVQPLERMQLAVQVSQQQLQVFVDGLALGQGVAQGAQLTQMPQGGWAWVVKEKATAAADAPAAG